jgi:hypothetical protein
MSFEKGNKANQKHYWLTPPEIYKQLNLEFEFDYDPCPFPKPDNYNGLEAEWGESNYVNPPFGSFIDKIRQTKNGPTVWAKKAIQEFKKGKRVVYVYPIDKWVFKMIEAGAIIRNLGDIHWLAIEDGSIGPGTGRHVACFILNPPNFKRTTKKKLKNLTSIQKLQTTNIQLPFFNI